MEEEGGGGGGGASAPSQSSTKPKAGATSSKLSLAKSYSTMSERRKQIDERRRLRNAKIAKHEAIRNANRDHQVYMSAQVRKRIETLLRGDYSNISMALGDDSDDDEDIDEERDDGDNDDDDEIRMYILQRLSHEGFTLRQAKTAYSETFKLSSAGSGGDDVDERMDSVYEECLQWLCIHLDEEQLPDGFDPRGRTLDVVVAGSKSKGGNKSSMATTQASLSQGARGGVSKGIAEDAFAFASKYGITDEEATLIMQSADNDTNTARALLWEALNKAAGASLSVDASAIDGSNEIMEEELEALGAIFPPEEYTVERNQGDNGQVTTIAIDFPDNGLKMRLEIEIQDNFYPNIHPRVFITGNWRECSKMPQGAGTAVHIEILNFLADLSVGDPMVYEVYGFIQGLLPSLPGGISIPITSGNDSLLLPHLEGGEAFVNAKSSARDAGTANKPRDSSQSKPKNKTFSRSNGDTSPTASRQRRPREKSFFWSKTPRQTPPAVAHPKLSTSMQNAREGLPAAKARGEFLAIMEKAEHTGRVVLVTGETGCVSQGCCLPCWLLGVQ